MPAAPREHNPHTRAVDGQQQQDAADTNEPLQDLRFIAGLAGSLTAHLHENWPVEGHGPPVAGAPTNFAISELYRHLLHLKTLLFRFRPPAQSPNPSSGSR